MSVANLTAQNVTTPMLGLDLVESYATEQTAQARRVRNVMKAAVMTVKLANCLPQSAGGCFHSADARKHPIGKPTASPAGLTGGLQRRYSRDRGVAATLTATLRRAPTPRTLRERCH